MRTTTPAIPLKKTRGNVGKCARGIALSVLALLGTAFSSYATVIGNTATTPAYQAGIGTYGNLFDSGVGLQRTSDGYDAIAPAYAREVWGVSAGSIEGYADYYAPQVPSQTVSNLTAPSSSFTLTTGLVGTFLNAGSGNLLSVSSAYSFLAGSSNILQIQVTLTNVSGVTQNNVEYLRGVDWKIIPSSPTFNISVTSSPLGGPVVAASANGDYHLGAPTGPLDGVSPQASVGSGPGSYTFTTADTVNPGAEFILNLGTLGAGQSKQFNIFQAVSNTGETQSGLQSQLSAAGATFIMTGVGTGGTNSAALAFGPVLGQADPVPEPASVLFGLATLGAVGLSRRRARAK